MLSPALTRWLSKTNGLVFSVYAIAAAFSTYFCMYAFRKPFAAGAFEGEWTLPFLANPIAFKTLLIISQVAGYCASKFLGIKIISELPAHKRGVGILFVIGFAWFALALFAIAPMWAKPLCLFLNGIPLGMVWGLVFGFLEGRRLSEVLGAGLSASYILASGVVKSLGAKLVAGFTIALPIFTPEAVAALLDACGCMDEHGDLYLQVTEYWMPFATGAIFVVPMMFFVWMLANLPPPSEEDEVLRTKREPMNAAARKKFLLAYLPGLLPLTVLYVVLTAYRDFRDNFAIEIWKALGYDESPAIMAWSELPITIIVLLTLAMLMVIKDNRTALLTVHVIMFLGTALIGLTTLLYNIGILPGELWMIAVGAGLYIAYVPYGCVLFDRLFAALGTIGTAGFLIYLTDAFGYLGAVALMLYKDLGQPDLSWLEFFSGASYGTSIICTILYACSMVYFGRLTDPDTEAGSPPAANPISA